MWALYQQSPKESSLWIMYILPQLNTKKRWNPVNDWVSRLCILNGHYTEKRKWTSIKFAALPFFRFKKVSKKKLNPVTIAITGFYCGLWPFRTPVAQARFFWQVVELKSSTNKVHKKNLFITQFLAIYSTILRKVFQSISPNFLIFIFLWFRGAVSDRKSVV